MSWKQFFWLMAAFMPGSLPGFAGVFILMGFEHINLPPVTGWLMILQSVLFVWLCVEKFTAPAILPTTGEDNHE